MSNLSQRYIAALAELSQFHYVQGDKNTLTHMLSGVQVAPETEDENAADAGFLRLTFGGGHTVLVIASHYLELMLSEDAAHRMHAAGEGTGEIYKRARQMGKHLARKHELPE